MHLAQSDDTLDEHSHTFSCNPWAIRESEKECVCFANHFLKELNFLCVLSDGLEVKDGNLRVNVEQQGIVEEPLQHEQQCALRGQLLAVSVARNVAMIIHEPVFTTLEHKVFVFLELLDWPFPKN